MRKQYLTLFILVFSFSFFFAYEAKSSILKNPFAKKPAKKLQETILEDSALKAKAVYLQLEGDNVEYDHESNVYITSGMSVANIVDQNAKLEADEIIYFGIDQHIETKGNVKITRDNIVTTGESFKFDVTSNKYLITRPQTVVKGAVIKARTLSSLPDNQVQYDHGRLTLDNPIKIAQGFGVRDYPGTFYSQQIAMIIRQSKPTWEEVSKKVRYRVTAEKIVYDSDKVVNNLTVYGGRVHFKTFSIPMAPEYTTTVNSDPNVRTAPLIAPTVGTQGALGGFAIGPNFNFNVDDYHILSVSPFGQLGKGGPGFGGMLGFVGPSTTAQLTYGSLKARVVGLIRQRIGNHLEFRTAYNQYLDNGFLGSTLAKANIELVDRRRLKAAFTESGIAFRTSTNWSQTNTGIFPSLYKGFLQQSGDPKNFKSSAFKLEEQITFVSKPLFKIGTEKYNTALRFRTRNALRAYSTGDFQGIFTGGPILNNTVGPLTFGLGYDQGYVQGKSPLFYDQFIQGMQSVSLDGDLKLHEWVTLGGYGTYNLKAAQLIERQFRAKIGPKDFKIVVNWDALRLQTQFGLNFLFGQPVDFEKFLFINSQSKAGGI